MILLYEKITVEQLRTMAANMFGNMVKAVVDVHRRKIVVDAELHSDEEAFLLENGSAQKHLWGINIYPDFDKDDEDFVEFDSMINLRPSQNNRTRGVEDPVLQQLIISVVKEWVV